MNLASTPHFDRRLKKRINKDSQLKKKVQKQLELVVSSPNHPSLKIHKLKGKRASELSFWIEDNLRVTFQVIENTILLTDIITHDEY